MVTTVGTDKASNSRPSSLVTDLHVTGSQMRQQANFTSTTSSLTNVLPLISQQTIDARVIKLVADDSITQMAQPTSLASVSVLAGGSSHAASSSRLHSKQQSFGDFEFAVGPSGFVSNSANMNLDSQLDSRSKGLLRI
ncbi:unnamed protein product [Protopolystoma xenopodis]|uniref:Uncharacterized protein n=1 Tax=Protopolystoma xenopodis TaxID=117903 RepID=A0A3S5CS77_9PLAT|nr:unnamed protein product [Protopolystoma xenopodis]